MIKATRPFAIVSGLLFLVLVGPIRDHVDAPIRAQSATVANLSDRSWPMVRHDAQHTGRSPVVGPLSGATLRGEVNDINWLSPNAVIVNSPVVSKGLDAYLTHVYEIFNPDRSGGYYQRFLLHVDAEGTASVIGAHAGVGPALDADGALYLARFTAVVGGRELASFNPDGTVRWQAPTATLAPTISPDGLIYSYSPNSLSLVALNRDGGIVRTIPIDNIPAFPVALGHDGSVYVAGNRGLTAVGPGGVVRWTLPITTNLPPVVGDDGTIYMAADRLTAVAPGGRVKWRLDLGAGAATSVALGLGGRIHVADGARIVAVAGDGSVEWARPIARLEPDIIVGGNGTVYFAEGHAIAALDRDGRRRWVYLARHESPRLALRPDGALLVIGSELAESGFGGRGASFLIWPR